MQCRICRGEIWTTAAHVPDVRYPSAAGPFRIARCRGCGVFATCEGEGFVDPTCHYPLHYAAFEQTRVTADPRPHRPHLPGLPHAVPGRYAWLWQVDAREGIRALDVGCGAGRVGDALQRFRGFQVTGIEPNPKAAIQARERGLRVHTGTLESFEADEPFDVVLMLHVLEHLPDPLAAVRRAGELLAPSGQLVLALPNVASLERLLLGRHWDAWDVPRHVHHFGPRSLTRLLKLANFEPGPVRFELYSILGRSLANRRKPDLPYAERCAGAGLKRLERHAGRIQAMLGISSAMQTVARWHRR
jgi:SAM-dependent methyltransferase